LNVVVVLTVDGDAHLQACRGGELGAEREGRAQRGDGRHRRVERAEEQAEAVVPGHDVALVEDDHRAGTRRRGVVDLVAEEARAPLDEGDVPRREAGEVRGLATARRRPVTGEVDVDDLHRSCDVGRARVVHRREVLVRDVDRGRRCRLLHGAGLEDELLVGELLPAHLVAGIAEEVLDVGARGLVAGRPRGARAAVGVGDRLEGLLVGEDAVDCHGLSQRARVRADVGRGRCDEDRGERRGGSESGGGAPEPGMVHHALLPWFDDQALRAGRARNVQDLRPARRETATPRGL
jgi:hypothetical protein